MTSMENDLSVHFCFCKKPEPAPITPDSPHPSFQLCLWCKKPILPSFPARLSRLPFYYAFTWLLATILSSFYVQQRDGAGWPVAIWAVQMLLLGFVKIPSVGFFSIWLNSRRLHGKPPGPLLVISTTLLVLVIYFATAIELYSIIWEISAPNNQPLHEVARQGFLWGLKTGTASILAIAAVVIFTVVYCAFFAMLCHIAVRIASGSRYPTICASCKKPLPILLLTFEADWLGNDIPLPSHVTKDEIRKCPHCSMPVLPEGLPRRIANYVGWSIITIMLASFPALRDGWGWPTILWALELALIPFGITPFTLKCFSWVTMPPSNQKFDEQPTWKKIVWASLIVGAPMGSFLGIILCLRYDWKIPLPFAGQLGLLIGPIVVGICTLPPITIFKIFQFLFNRRLPLITPPAKS